MHRKRYSVATAALIALLVLIGAALSGHLSVSRAQEEITIAVGDIWYCDPADTGGVCETDIYAGDTITWDFSAAALPHTVTYCDDPCDLPAASPLWDSGIISDRSMFSYTFTQAGSFAYRCELHTEQQRGRIVVHAGERPPTATLVLASPAVDYLGKETPRPTPTALPYTGGQSPAGDARSFAAIAFFSAGIALIVTSCALAMRGRTSRSR